MAQLAQQYVSSAFFFLTGIAGALGLMFAMTYRWIPWNSIFHVRSVASRLIDPGPLPKKADADAIHIAVATVYGCEYLLTWNFKHINNAKIKREASRIIEQYGYRPSTICTPEELMGSD